MHGRHVRFFEHPEYSDYKRPNFTTPLLVCLAIVLASLVAYACMCRRGVRQSSSCGACVSARATSNHGGGGGAVHARDAAHLSETIRSSHHLVVVFWAPWCGHCVQMKPHVLAAAEEHHEVTYMLVNCEEAVGHDTLQEHGVQAFPTIRFYKGGRAVDEYSGPRSKEEIQAWARSHAE